MRWLRISEDWRGEPPARVVFREHQLHVLGVSASGRDAGCGGEDWEMALLKHESRPASNLPEMSQL